MAAPEIAKGDQRVENAQKGFADTLTVGGKKAGEAARKLPCLLFYFFSPFQRVQILSSRPSCILLMEGEWVREGVRDREWEWVDAFFFWLAILRQPCNLSYFNTRTLQVVLKQERIFFFFFFTFSNLLNCEWNVWLNKMLDDRKCETQSFFVGYSAFQTLFFGGHESKCPLSFLPMEKFRSSSRCRKQEVTAQPTKIVLLIVMWNHRNGRKAAMLSSWQRPQHSDIVLTAFTSFFSPQMFNWELAGSRFVLTNWYGTWPL